MKIHLIMFFFLSIVISIVMGRPLAMSSNGNKSNTVITESRMRLQDEGTGSTYNSCWESMFELQSCTGEMILFFLNGETHLGTECCRAVRTIKHHCWPNLLGSLGYTSQERDVLYQYCDGEPATPPVHCPTSRISPRRP